MAALLATGKPYLFGVGPPTCSTSLALEKFPSVVFDVNGYYACLGIFPKATRAEIRQAYLSMAGHESSYRTFVVKQLLNPQIRAAYDASPCGSLFLDKYQHDWLMRALAVRNLIPALLDSDPGASDDDVSLIPTSPEDVGGWRFSYYLWGDVEVKEITQVLETWQHALIHALGGYVVQIAVGLMANQNKPWEVCKVGYRVVAFLAEDAQPTQAIALAAADRVMQLTRRPVML